MNTAQVLSYSYNVHALSNAGLNTYSLHSAIASLKMTSVVSNFCTAVFTMVAWLCNILAIANWQCAFYNVDAPSLKAGKINF